MANNQFINLEELSKTTQALLSKINEQSNLKVNKANVSAEYSEGTKIAEIEDVEIYAPEAVDTSNLATYDDLESLYSNATNYDNLRNKPTLATVATSGSYNDLSNKPTIPSSDDFVSSNNYPIFMLNAEYVTGSGRRVAYLYYGSLQNVIKYGSGSNGAPFLVYVQEPITGTTTNLLPNKIYVKDKYNNSNLINLKFYESRQPIVPLSYAFTLNSGFYYAELDWHDNFQDSTVMIYTYGFYDDTAISSRISALENAGYITSYTETDPTVPAWAKAATKPTYTAAEVGALPDNLGSSNVGKVLGIGSDGSVSPVTPPAGAVIFEFEVEYDQQAGEYIVTTGPSWTEVMAAATATPAQPVYAHVVDVSDGNDVSSGFFMSLTEYWLAHYENQQEQFSCTFSYVYGCSIINIAADTYWPQWHYSYDDLTGIDARVGYLESDVVSLNNNKLNKNLGTSEAGKFLVVDSNGNINVAALPVTSVNEETGNVIISKIKTTAPNNNVEYNLMGTTNNNNTMAVSPYNQDLLSFAKTTDFSRLTIGSTTMPGKIRLYSSANSASGYTELKSNSSSTNAREVVFPDASGTVALTTDIPSVPSWALANNKPNYTFSELTSHPTTLNDYGITDAYTKTEVDGLVSGVLHYKGAKSTTSALPSSGNVTGDVWHVTADSSEWAWDGSEWQELGTTVDLSGYLQSSDISAWAKAANKPSYTASEVGALPSSTTYVSSFNGQSGAITYIPPVSSVNGQTGVVSLSIPDVPSWALASSKPNYTASEVGALPSSTTYVSSFNGSTGAITYTAPVASVNGQTGAVTLSIPSTPADIGAASATHAHGNITSGGDMTATAAIASGDRLVINDESASKLVSSIITFGSSTAQYLANNGTWQNVPSTYDDTALAARVSALEQIPWVTYYTGSTTPSNSQGNNGDLYFQTAQ